MLISMIFSVELFASVLFGLLLGKLLFPLEQVQAPRHQTPTTSLLDPEDANSADQGNRRRNNFLLNNGVSNDGSSATSVRRRRRWPIGLVVHWLIHLVYIFSQWKLILSIEISARWSLVVKRVNTTLITKSINRYNYELRRYEYLLNFSRWECPVTKFVRPKPNRARNRKSQKRRIRVKPKSKAPQLM